MGNKFTRRKIQIDERYTRPQGLYEHKDLDHRRLRRLIIDAKIAPCYPGAEDAAIDLDECPICFLNYPSLNRSKCCTKGICTECFLQVKAPSSVRPAQCPFCKTPNYGVEYFGARTLEEKDVEQAEEQKVIEAKIRIRRQQEIQDEEARLQRRDQAPQEDPPAIALQEDREQESTAPGERDQDQTMPPPERNWDSWSNQGSNTAIGYPQSAVFSNRQSVFSSTSARNNASSRRQHHHPWSDNGSSRDRPGYNRDEDFNLDLEDIMVMEAIWLSLQEQVNPRAMERINVFPAVLQDQTEEQASVTAGFASAIAILAERQAGGNGRDLELAAGDSIDSGSVSNAHGTSETQSLEEQIRISSGLDNLDKDDKSIVGASGAEARTIGLTAAGAALSAATGAALSAATGAALSAATGAALSAATGSVETNAAAAASGAAADNTTASVNNNENLTRWIRRGMSVESSPDALLDQGSEVVEAGTSCCSSVPSVLPWEAPDEDHQDHHQHQQHHHQQQHQQQQHPEEQSFGSGGASVSEIDGGRLDEAATLGFDRRGASAAAGGGAARRLDSAASREVPESFEEQMLMAMALSLAEARALSQAK